MTSARFHFLTRFVAAIAFGAVACGGDAVRPTDGQAGVQPSLVGTFALQTINGQPVPFMMGIGYRPNASFTSPPDSIYYVSERVVFAKVTTDSGSATHTRSFVYHSRPAHPDTTTSNSGGGWWTAHSGVYVSTYGATSDTLGVETDLNAFRIHLPGNGLSPAGFELRYVRVAP